MQLARVLGTVVASHKDPGLAAVKLLVIQPLNAEGKPRSWTDHLLWHHACHTVDQFQYQSRETVSDLAAFQGPIHPELGIAMDMSLAMKVPGGAICTLALSFNNHGPLGTFFRYICDNGTYIARRCRRCI